jgi:diguanylate cyclase (GGDEF)-like protein
MIAIVHTPQGRPASPSFPFHDVMTRSFRVQVALLFGALALAVVAALAYPLGTLLGRAQLNERGAALAAISNGVALLFAEGLRERLREVDLLTQSPEARRMGLDPAGWDQEIQRLRNGRPHYAWIGVTDGTGKVIAASNGMLVGRDVSQRPWFVGGKQGPYLGDVHAAKLLSQMLPPPGDGEPLRFIDLAAPLHTPEGALLGTLGVHVDWRWAREVVAELHSEDARDDGVLVYIFDQDGKVIHRPLGTTADDHLADALNPIRGAALRTWADGQPYLTASTRLPARAEEPDLGWTVVVRQPAEQALEGVAQARRQVWRHGSVVSALAMLLVWVAAGLFSGPLRDISRAAERIEAGRHDTPIPQLRQSSEIEQLSRSLARMTQHLVAREQALAQANEHLEARVAERTAELARVNEELARANEHLDSLAHIDSLTGLINRRGADQLLASLVAQARRHHRPLGVLLCDVDHFKRVNDNFGHATGDDVLRAVATALRQTLRESDSAARFGGEEFVVLLPETDADGVAVVGEKIRRAIATLQLPEVGRCTISVGGAVTLNGRTLPLELLARADEALYEAKAQGRDRVCLAPVEALPAGAGPGWVASTMPVPLDV